MAMKPDDITKEWLLQNKKICICRGIPRKRILAAIKKGAASLAEVNRMTGAGGGDCRGERCGPEIEKLLTLFTGAK